MKQELKPSVRMNIEAKKKLEEIQSLTNKSQTALLDRAVELLEHEILSQQMASDLEDLCANPSALATYKATSSVFDNATSDGVRKK